MLLTFDRSDKDFCSFPFSNIDTLLFDEDFLNIGENRMK